MLHAPVILRPFATCFALVLGLLGAWIIAAEAMRPGPLGFPPAAAAQTMGAENAAAAAAARVGWPRGDLWADYAVTANATSTGSAAEAAETAARLTPSDARAWVLLAMNSQGPANDAKTAALLKMSYYTSPYSDALFPLRLQTATRSAALADEELASFADYEVGVGVGKPDLRQSLAPIYRSASAAGRNFFDTAIKKIDPAFLVQLKR